MLGSGSYIVLVLQGILEVGPHIFATQYMAVHVLIASSCPEHFRKPRFMPYNSRHHIFARGALGEKARELEDEFAQMHPYPPDEFLDKLEQVAADMRVQCPLWLADTLELLGFFLPYFSTFFFGLFSRDSFQGKKFELFFKPLNKAVQQCAGWKQQVEKKGPDLSNDCAALT